MTGFIMMMHLRRVASWRLLHRKVIVAAHHPGDRHGGELLPPCLAQGWSAWRNRTMYEANPVTIEGRGMLRLLALVAALQATTAVVLPICLAQVGLQRQQGAGSAGAACHT